MTISGLLNSGIIGIDLIICYILKNQTYLIMRSLYILIFSLVCFSCSQTSSPQQESPAEPISLLGTWDLLQYIDADDEQGKWLSYADTILYQKHLTSTHFTWIKYDLKNDQMLGMGGGNYHLKDNQYVENIDFFHPPSSSELGQSIPFEVRHEGGKWYHTGYAKEMSIDFDEGTMVALDSNKIEEIWTRNSAQLTKDPSLHGTWGLEQYRYDKDDSYFEYPDMMGYMKLITSSHFIWVKYDTEGDQIFASGSGTYSYDGSGNYKENIEMMHPPAHTLRGTSVEFQIEISDHRWDLLGYGIQQPSGDTLLIDEVWRPHSTSLEEEVAVSL